VGEKKQQLAHHLAIFPYQESMCIRAVIFVKLLSRVISTLIRHYLIASFNKIAKPAAQKKNANCMNQNLVSLIEE